MIAVFIEKRPGTFEHSYRVCGEYGRSLILFAILERPALDFLCRVKREHPDLVFQASIEVQHDYINDGFVPDLVLTLLSANNPDLAQSLLQDFVQANAVFVKGED